VIPITPLELPGLFVTATDTAVGKTLVASAIARTLRARGRRVAVLKPVASGCYRAREGLISDDAELLAAASDTHHPLDLICPNRYEEPLAPAVAARRAKTPMDWDAVARSIRLMSADSDCMIVEGAGGVLVPTDDRHTMLDLIVALGLPAVVVARPSLGTINHTILSVEVLRSAGVRVAGVVINRYPAESAGVAEETSPREIEKFGKVPVLSIVPDEPFKPPVIGPGVMAAIGQVDWESKLAAGSISRQS
jgi:dethiobiotin synthetase